MKSLRENFGKGAPRTARLKRWRIVRRRGHVGDESGAILILALIYLVVISLTVAALATWSTNDVNNSAHFSNASSLQVSASGMMNVAIQYVRYNPGLSSSQEEGVASPLVACWGAVSIANIQPIDGNQIAVWCSTTWNPLSQITRDVMFYACPISVTAQSCASGNALLTAEVYYDDYPPPPAVSAPIQVLCTVWCGEGMTIHNWMWGASLPGSVVGVAASLSFTTEPSDTVVGVATSAAVTVLDANENPVAGDTVSLAVQSGPSPDNLNAQLSVLSATTNSSGVASFTSLVPQYAGNYTLSAVDGAVTTTSSSFVVGKGQNSITVTSTVPANATAGGPTYTATATALSGDDVAIASGTTSICTVPPSSLSPATVTFVATGTCVLDFTDGGNANYGAILVPPVTQSIPVASSTPTQVVLTPASSTPTASAKTNDAVALQLENVVGVATTSTGTTTLTLSDSGNGFFATANAATGASTINVSFASGVGTATVYFGNEGAGSDTLSAVKGTTSWGTTAVNVQAGAAAEVAITPNSTSPQDSSTTNDALSLQLEDQFGNNVTSSTTTTLTLSDSSGGFFATSTGVSGAATLNVSFASGVGTATAYFGDQTTGSSIITAMNGTVSWGTSTLTVSAGTPVKVGITVSPATPAHSTSTNTTVTLQLEDTYGNAVATSGYSFTLSNSGSGFFASSNGTSRNTTSTITVSTSSSGGAVTYFGDNSGTSVTITATKSGGSSWGTVTFNL